MYEPLWIQIFRHSNVQFSCSSERPEVFWCWLRCRVSHCLTRCHVLNYVNFFPRCNVRTIWIKSEHSTHRICISGPPGPGCVLVSGKLRKLSFEQIKLSCHVSVYVIAVQSFCISKVRYFVVVDAVHIVFEVDVAIVGIKHDWSVPFCCTKSITTVPSIFGSFQVFEQMDGCSLFSLYNSMTKQIGSARTNVVLKVRVDSILALHVTAYTLCFNISHVFLPLGIIVWSRFLLVTFEYIGSMSFLIPLVDFWLIKHFQIIQCFPFYLRKISFLSRFGLCFVELFHLLMMKLHPFSIKLAFFFRYTRLRILFRQIHCLLNHFICVVPFPLSRLNVSKAAVVKGPPRFGCL
uniref:Uncharacterized protein n=1 Tax=Cacopsylla melanoneura TaxID=428564 RepID=A0A8D8V0F3_9HEMI